MCSPPGVMARCRTWMTAGNDPTSAVSGLTLDVAVIAIARLTHLVAVIAALALMFRADANRYFARR